MNENLIKNQFGRLPIHNICLSEPFDLEKLELILELYPNVAISQDNEGYTPFHMVCQSANFEGFQKLCQTNQSGIKVCASNGRSPLHFAAQSGSLAICHEILNLWPEATQIQSNDGRLPLHLACIGQGSHNVSHLLLDSYPEAATVLTIDNFLPIHIASEFNFDFSLITRLLELNPLHIFQSDSRSQNPLEISLHSNNLIASSSIFQFLLTNQSKSSFDSFQPSFPPLYSILHSPNPLTGRTLFHLFCLHASRHSPRSLPSLTPVNNGPNLSPHLSTKEASDTLLSLLRIFLTYTPPPSMDCHSSPLAAQDMDGHTVFHMAAQGGETVLFAALLEYDKDHLYPAHRILSHTSRSALHFAAQQGHLEICRLILLLCPEFTNLSSSQPEGQPALAHQISPLHLACTFHHNEVINEIISTQRQLKDEKNFEWQINGLGLTPLQVYLQEPTSQHECTHRCYSSLELSTLNLLIDSTPAHPTLFQSTTNPCDLFLNHLSPSPNGELQTNVLFPFHFGPETDLSLLNKNLSTLRKLLRKYPYFQHHRNWLHHLNGYFRFPAIFYSMNAHNDLFILTQLALVSNDAWKYVISFI